MIGAIIDAAVLGAAVLVGIAGHYAILKDDDDDDDEGRDALFKTALNKCSQRKVAERLSSGATLAFADKRQVNARQVESGM